MSDGDICRDDERHGGFGAVVAKRQKKSGVPTPAPQAGAPAEAPAPAEKKSPPVVEKKSPPVLVAAPTVAPAPFSFGEPIHPSGIVVKVVGTEMSCQGRSCKEHDNCGKVLKEDIVVRLRKIQLMVEGKEETAIAAIWVTDGIDCCRVDFVPQPHGTPCRTIRQSTCAGHPCS